MKFESVPESNLEAAGIIAFRTWFMIALATVFVLLYSAALLGWIKPLADERIVARLEPIIFVIIGYYFGRLPAQQNEQTLKSEISRQTQKSDAAQHSKEQAQQSREALEEKLKNVRVTLASSATATAAKSLAVKSDEAAASAADVEIRQAVKAALGILNS
jgi:hypothetical protein